MAFGRQFVGTHSNFFMLAAPQSPRVGCGSKVRIIGIISVILLTGSSAFGQFMVSPAKVHLKVRPGRAEPTEVSINNTLNEPQTVDLRLIHLTQSPSGGWAAIEPNDPNVDTTKLRSCRSWLTLAEGAVEMPAGQMVPLKMDVKVPAGTPAGYYFAAIMASLRPPEIASGGFSAPIALQILVPIIVEVQGRFLRRDVTLTNVGLTFRRQSDTTTPASLANLRIENRGQTYSSLEAKVRIYRNVGGHDRRIKEVRVPSSGSMGILPEVTLELAQDIGRPLPAGEYRVQGFLWVDGRRSNGWEEMVTFEGDPRAPNLIHETDTALELDPGSVETVVPAAPGRLRQANIILYNASEETVQVDVSAVLPEHLTGIGWQDPATGQPVRGDVFDCSDWLTFMPEQFTLDGYARGFVTVRCLMPEDAPMLAEYVANLRFHARYPDGQDGGVAIGRLYAENTRLEATPRVQIVSDQISGEASPSRYFVTASGRNVGDTRILPRCRGVVRRVEDQYEMDRFEMSSDLDEGQQGPLLPLESRRFAGVLDVSNFGPTQYVLTIALEGDKGGSHQQQEAFEVIEENGVKSIRRLELSDVGGPMEIRL